MAKAYKKCSDDKEKRKVDLRVREYLSVKINEKERGKYQIYYNIKKMDL
ncbi:MAG: hypothetical protein QXI33_02585 [Candidatus Pacearchaeota archaeon]